MKQKQFTTTVIEADEDKFLTQASKDIDINDRVIGTKIAIGANDSPDNWCEISKADAEEFFAQRSASDAISSPLPSLSDDAEDSSLIESALEEYREYNDYVNSCKEEAHRRLEEMRRGDIDEESD